MILEGKRILVTGVATHESIAFAVAREAQLAGAEVALTSFGRMRSLTQRAAKRLPEPVEIYELDATKQEDYDALREELLARWGTIDGALHSIAYAPPDAIGGDFLATSRESAKTAFELSAYSFKDLAAALLPLMSRDDGTSSSLVTLSFDTDHAWPTYDWMGVAKASLESVSRYLSCELGPRGVRVNVVSAGPLLTLAAREIPKFFSIEEIWQMRASLGWNLRDTSPIAHAVCFLFSHWARAISGEVLHVDGGVNAVGFYPDRFPEAMQRLMDSTNGAKPALARTGDQAG
jgi:meromycolic acid enoyl-[acyl-carrier-protein] reductase